MEDIFRELLFLGKCHHSFLDKPYQELDFTRHLNSVLGRNTVRSADVSHDFISFICFCSRLCWSWKVPISILRLMKICVRFQYVPWKNVWLCFISIASVYFSHKIEKFHLELKHNNNKKRNGVTSEYVSWKNVGFCFIPKTDKFHFKSHWNTSNFFYKKRY